MFHKLFILAALSFFLGNRSAEKMRYHKEYYETGKTKEEGWVQKGIKMGYWIFYYPNGNISEKGHYENGSREKYWFFYRKNETLGKGGHYSNGKKTDWWCYYDLDGELDYKCQLNLGIKNRICLQFDNGEISSAVKYKNGKRIKEYYDLRSFKRENRLSDLR